MQTIDIQVYILKPIWIRLQHPDDADFYFEDVTTAMQQQYNKIGWETTIMGVEKTEIRRNVL